MHPTEIKIRKWLKSLDLAPENISSRNRDNISLIRKVLETLLKTEPSPEPCNCRINTMFTVTHAPDGTIHEMFCRKIHPKVVT